jgi:hypothetical protein
VTRRSSARRAIAANEAQHSSEAETLIVARAGARIEIVILPFDRRKLSARSERDDREARADARTRSTAERLAAGLGLSQFVLELGRAAGAGVGDREAELAEKSRLYAVPLRVLHGRP